MDFVALDFETANHNRDSVCEVGIAVVQAGEVVETLSKLVRPKANWFHSMNTRIHGIDANCVKNEPEFDIIWEEVGRWFEDSNVVAHNASFDISVLRHVLMQYGLPFPEFNYTCSLMVARGAWKGLKSYGLSSLSEKFSIQLKHHSAESDALACALILLKAFDDHGIRHFEEIENIFEVRTGKVFPGGYIPAGKLQQKKHTAPPVQELKADLSRIDKSHPLNGKD